MFHWHTGTMTRRSEKLEQEVPEAYIEMHPDDAAAIGLDGQRRVRVISQRGEIELGVRVTKHIRPGVVFHSLPLRRGRSQRVDPRRA